MEHFEVLEGPIVDDIKSFKVEEWNKRKLSGLYPNVILRSDVLQILDLECIVVYYPLENERNHGFHISGMEGRDGEKFTFVYINTSQTIEKQVFTAAHELGHTWHIEEYISEKRKEQFDEHYKERIVNRFAAELLMPEEEFREQYKQASIKYSDKKHRITFTKFLKMVASLMQFFLVPMKAVMARMAELHFISVDTVNRFISDGDGNLSDIVKKSMDRIFREEGYTDLYQPTNKKYIEGLAELLEEAEEQETVTPEKIRNVRARFDLENETMDKLPEQDIMLEG